MLWEGKKKKKKRRSRETGSPSQVSLASPDESSIYSVSSPEWLSHKHSHEGSHSAILKRLNDIGV